MKQTLSLICALAHNRVIGRGNDLPWHIPKDLEHFRDITRHKPIIMGRMTYDSILMRRNGKPLPDRTHYVVTSQKFTTLPDRVFTFPSLADAVAAARKDNPETEVFIIGGASLYAQSMDMVDKMYLTEIDLDIPDGDAFFPEYNRAEWNITDQQSFKEETPPFTFLTLVRK